jgi:Gpi18-like mannosyltransferase
MEFMLRNKNLIDSTSILLLLLAIKSMLFFWGSVQFDFLNHPHETTASIWNRWDALHYQEIAQYGYTGKSDIKGSGILIYFPPLYPAMIAAVSKVLDLNYITASILVSNIFSFLSSILLFFITKYECRSRIVACKAVLALNLFPTSYFLLAPFSEPVFLFFVLLGFYYIRINKSYMYAFISISFAILTRSAGIVLLPVFLIILLLDTEFRPKYLWYILMPLLAGCSQKLIGYLYFDDPFMMYKDRPLTVIQFGYVPFLEAYSTAKTILGDFGKLQNSDFMMQSGWGMFFLMGACMVILASIRQLHWNYSFFALSYLLFLSCFIWAIPMPRYILCCFPLYLVIGRIKNVWIFGSICCAAFVMLLHFTSIFVNGSWAF